MTPEDSAKLLPIIKAFSEGKEIEYLNSEDKWITLPYMAFTSETHRYRIKNKHQKLIDAYKAGAKIQFLSYDGKTWLDVGIPMWHEKVQYRVKRDIIQYRRYIFTTAEGTKMASVVNFETYSSAYIENIGTFVRWIDEDWITEEV